MDRYKIRKNPKIQKRTENVFPRINLLNHCRMTNHPIESNILAKTSRYCLGLCRCPGGLFWDRAPHLARQLESLTCGEYRDDLVDHSRRRNRTANNITILAVRPCQRGNGNSGQTKETPEWGRMTRPRYCFTVSGAWDNCAPSVAPPIFPTALAAM